MSAAAIKTAVEISSMVFSTRADLCVPTGSPLIQTLIRLGWGQANSENLGAATDLASAAAMELKRKLRAAFVELMTAPSL
jgi:hypothetical protein